MTTAASNTAATAGAPARNVIRRTSTRSVGGASGDPPLVGVLEVLGDDGEQHAVDPAVPMPVRLALDALADEAGALGVPERALVEAVDLELQPVEAPLPDELVLEQPGGVVGEAAAPEGTTMPPASGSRGDRAMRSASSSRS
jgi:hypothetical protein